MKLGSLFDGSGGFPLGGILNGIEPVWASEIEPFPIRVTTKRLPFMKRYGDVSKINGAEVEPVDIICFGSPCQGLSNAGLKKGLEGDDRSHLFYQAVRIIKEMREATNGLYPTYAIWENVPGAFSSNRGNDFLSVLESLAGVKEAVSIPKPKKWESAGYIRGNGWSIAWRVLDAQYFKLAQRRKRLYLVADFADERANEILFEPEGVSRHIAEGFKSWERIAYNSSRGVGEAIGIDGYNGCTTGGGSLYSRR